MAVNNESSTSFMDEIRSISPWAYFLAGLAFVGIFSVLMFVTHHDKTAPPVLVMILLAIVAGTISRVTSC